ncbi:MAG: hypothetical protein QXX95_01445 [Nitrososphaerales archaeon]
MAIEDIWVTEEELLEGLKGGWGLILDALTYGKPLYDLKKFLEPMRKFVGEKYKRIGKIWVLRDG